MRVHVLTTCTYLPMYLPACLLADLHDSVGALGLLKGMKMVQEVGRKTREYGCWDEYDATVLCKMSTVDGCAGSWFQMSKRCDYQILIVVSVVQ